MSETAKLLYAGVRHRLDDLENHQRPKSPARMVRHRLDDLEKSISAGLTLGTVRHRLDDLEILIVGYF